MATLNARSYSTPRNINLKGQGVSRGGILRFEGTNPSNPLSSVSNGLYVNTSNQLTFAAQGVETVLGSGGGGSVSLDGAYDQGRSITVDAGAITFNDSTAGALNTLAIAKSGAGSGNVIDVTFSAAHTGNTIDIDFTSAIAANGLHLNSASGARTGADILVTDDSIGAHSVIDINSSGSGASVGFDFTGSYNGSPGGQAIKVTFDASDNLDTEVMQVGTGAGARGIMFDLNLDHTDSSTTSHVFDIDMGGIFDSNVLDVAYAAASTGNTIFINLDNAVAATALHIEGSGARTQPMVELASDATGSASLVNVTLTGAISGHILEVSMDTTSTGDVLNVDMNASVGGRAIFLDAGNATRTANLIDITNDGDGNIDTFEIADSNTGSGHVFDIDSSGVGSGNVIDITYSAADTGNAVNVVMANNVAGAALNITGAGIRTDSIIEVVSSETGSVDGMVLLQTTGVFTGSMLTIHSDAAATTGSLLHLDLDAGVAYKAITIDQAGARTAANILSTFDGTFGSGGGGTFLDANISMTGAGASPYIDVDISGIYTGNILDVTIGAVAATGDVISIDLGATATTSQAIVIASGNMTRTTALISVADAGTASGATFNIDSTAARTGIVFDIDDTAITTGNIFDYATNSASTGTIFEVTLANAVAAKLQNFTLSGTRTADAITYTTSAAGAVDVVAIADSGTSSGHIFDINISGNSTGNVIDIVASTAKAAGHFINMDLATDLAGNAINIAAAGTRTAPIINIANAGADGGTDDHVIYIAQSGLLNSDVLNITYSSAASDGNAIMVAMGTNVAGSAMQVTSAGTGTSGEGCAIDIAHTGNLAAGANLVDIISTGSHSSTSNVVSIQATTGASTVGSYALYVNASGANIEGLKVDAGAVVFDETLTVTGLATLTAGITASVIFAGTETIGAGGTTTALSLAKTMHYVDADVGGDIFTLANGTEGQIAIVVCASATGVATVTPETMKGGTSATLNAAGDTVMFAFVGSGWSIIGGNGYSVV